VLAFFELVNCIACCISKNNNQIWGSVFETVSFRSYLIFSSFSS
jgi:hypothetical protein